MKIRDLVKRLKENGIDVSLAGNSLEINFDGDELADDLLEELKSNKTGIINFLKELHGVPEEPIPKLPPQPSYQLSSAQRRLWLVSQFEEANVAYNNPMFYALYGSLNYSAFEQAVQALVERHEILRTVLKADEDGEVRQYILSTNDIGVQVRFHDMRNQPNAEAASAELFKAVLATPMDLAKGPLLSGDICQVADNAWILGFAIHHIISDGWSGGIFMQDLFALYNAAKDGRPNPLPPTRTQYKDYSAWQQAQLSGEQLQGHRDYWLEQLSGDLPLLDLVGDNPRPPLKTYNGATINKDISIELTKAVRHLTQEQGATLFMGLVAAVNVLLHRYTGHTDIIIGFPIAGRDHPDLEDQIGFYINTLTLRTRFSSTDSFRQILNNVKQVTIGAYEHQVYPFEDLVDNLHLQRDPSRSPLFNVVAVLHNALGAAGQDSGGASQEENTSPPPPTDEIHVGEYKGTPNAISKFDINFEFGEVGEAMFARIEYNTDIFNANTIERMLGHFEQLLTMTAAQPDLPIAQLDLLTPDEKTQLLKGFNNTAAPYAKDKTVINLFEAQAASVPNKAAVVHGPVQLSYQQVNETANRLAAYLTQAMGVQPGNTVAIQLGRSGWLVTAILGVLKAGAAYLPIDPAYPAERMAWMQADSGSKLLINEDFIAQFILTAESYSNQNPVRAAQPEDVAYIIYTSGSTGQPKGVMVQHKALSNLCAWHNTRYSVTAADRATLYAGVAFDASVWEMFPYLISGATLYAVPDDIRLDVWEMGRFYEYNQISISFLPTQIAERFMTVDNSSLRYLLTGGDKLNSFTRQRYTVVNNYGPTENTVVATSYEVTAQEPNIPIGKPIANAQLYILDEQGQLCPIGAPGELCIAGDGLALGYLNQPELTAQKFVANPFAPGERMYKTGDLCRWLSDGNIAFMGRKDEQVKLRGYRIEPGEIEAVLQDYPAVEQAAVVIKSLANGEKELVAYLVSNQTLNAQEVRLHLGASLPAYMIPAFFVQLPHLPLTTNGKINRDALPDPVGVQMESGTAYMAPQNETEQKLAEIWEEVLGKENIGTMDNFFDLGGNSLKIVKMIGMVNAVFNKKIPVINAFKYPSISTLANYMNASETVIFTDAKKLAMEASVDMFEQTINIVNQDSDDN